MNLELCEQILQIHFCKCHSGRPEYHERFAAVVFPAGFKVARLESRSSCGVRDKSVSCIFYKPGRKVLTPVYFGKRRIRTRRTRERLNRSAIFRQFRVITFACKIAIIRFPGTHRALYVMQRAASSVFSSSHFSFFLFPPLFSPFRISGNGHCEVSFLFFSSLSLSEILVPVFFPIQFPFFLLQFNVCWFSLIHTSSASL